MRKIVMHDQKRQTSINKYQLTEIISSHQNCFHTISLLVHNNKGILHPYDTHWLRYRTIMEILR